MIPNEQDAGEAGAIHCPLYLELERRTSPARLVSKVERYCGYYLRVLKDEARCVVRSVLIVHHDPRSDHWRARASGSGAEALRWRIKSELESSSGATAHYRALDERLMEMDRTLDIGRMFVLVDWRALRELDFGAPLFPVSSYPSESETSEGGDEYAWRVSFKEVVEEWKWTVDAIGKHLPEGRC